jgi:hypothetical protein
VRESIILRTMSGKDHLLRGVLSMVAPTIRHKKSARNSGEDRVQSPKSARVPRA